jgi:hypothetical protein
LHTTPIDFATPSRFHVLDHHVAVARLQALLDARAIDVGAE